MKSWKVDDIIRVPAYSGGWRVWRVIGIFLGGENQENVIELETLDRNKNTQGRMCVPEELLNALAQAWINGGQRDRNQNRLDGEMADTPGKRGDVRSERAKGAEAKYKPKHRQPRLRQTIMQVRFLLQSLIFR